MIKVALTVLEQKYPELECPNVCDCCAMKLASIEAMITHIHANHKEITQTDRQDRKIIVNISE